MQLVDKNGDDLVVDQSRNPHTLADDNPNTQVEGDNEVEVPPTAKQSSDDEGRSQSWLILIRRPPPPFLELNFKMWKTLLGLPTLIDAMGPYT